MSGSVAAWACGAMPLRCAEWKDSFEEFKNEKPKEIEILEDCHVECPHAQARQKNEKRRTV